MTNYTHNSYVGKLCTQSLHGSHTQANRQAAETEEEVERNVLKK